MSGLAGSCCEEQEAREAAARKRIRAATELTEARLMWAHRVGSDVKRSLRCGDALLGCTDARCTHESCGDCDDAEGDKESDTLSKTSPAATDEDDASEDDDFEDDAEEAELMAKMRAARLGQMQTQQVAQISQPTQAVRAPQRTKMGTYTRLPDDESLASLLEESTRCPIVLHLDMQSDDSPVDSKLCVVVTEQMSRVAPTFTAVARLVTHLCTSRRDLPVWLQVPSLPALVTLQNRRVSSMLREVLGELREHVIGDTVGQWLVSERERLVAARRRKDESDDDDDDDVDNTSKSYCGRPGCKPYWHEHR